jgi:hypothetical protein
VLVLEEVDAGPLGDRREVHVVGPGERAHGSWIRYCRRSREHCPLPRPAPRIASR